MCSFLCGWVPTTNAVRTVVGASIWTWGGINKYCSKHSRYFGLFFRCVCAGAHRVHKQRCSWSSNSTLSTGCMWELLPLGRECDWAIMCFCAICASVFDHWSRLQSVLCLSTLWVTSPEVIKVYDVHIMGHTCRVEKVYDVYKCVWSLVTPAELTSVRCLH